MTHFQYIFMSPPVELHFKENEGHVQFILKSNQHYPKNVSNCTVSLILLFISTDSNKYVQYIVIKVLETHCEGEENRLKKAYCIHQIFTNMLLI